MSNNKKGYSQKHDNRGYYVTHVLGRIVAPTGVVRGEMEGERSEWDQSSSAANQASIHGEGSNCGGGWGSEARTPPGRPHAATGSRALAWGVSWSGWRRRCYWPAWRSCRSFPLIINPVTTPPPGYRAERPRPSHRLTSPVRATSAFRSSVRRCHAPAGEGCWRARGAFAGEIKFGTM